MPISYVISCESGNALGQLNNANGRIPACLPVNGIPDPVVFVPYVEPTDSTAIYSQLVALNEFDPLKIAGVVTFCFVMFMVGFGVGLVIRNLRRL